MRSHILEGLNNIAINTLKNTKDPVSDENMVPIEKIEKMTRHRENMLLYMEDIRFFIQSSLFYK